MTLSTIEQVMDLCWTELGYEPAFSYELALGDKIAIKRVAISGERRLLPSIYDITGFATAVVGTVGLALIHLANVTNRQLPTIAINSRSACVAFQSEKPTVLQPLGWNRPALWDFLSGDYQCADSWIRVHTNYSNHRNAALKALGLPLDANYDTVAAVLKTQNGDTIEESVVEAGGCAAVMRKPLTWRHHPHGSIAIQEPVLRMSSTNTNALATQRWQPSDNALRPLEGLRVIDLTRVIAGPVCTRVLAALGADVLRIDPPAFEEVESLLPDTTTGKRCCALDLKDANNRDQFMRLLSQADVVVHGFRPGAMEKLQLSKEEIWAINPGLLIARLNAYGWEGPWNDRRGFDSLVQMNSGLSWMTTATYASEVPVHLPAQALDHGTGYLLATAIIHSLADATQGKSPVELRTSLIATANLLTKFPDDDGLALGPTTWQPSASDIIERDSTWGRLRCAPMPFSINNHIPEWSIDSGPLGRDSPSF